MSRTSPDVGSDPDRARSPACRLSTHRFSGRDGLDRLARSGRGSSPNDDEFRADLVRLLLGPVVLERFRATELRWRSDPDPAVRDAASLLTVVFLEEGELLVEFTGGRSFLLVPGDTAVFDSREATRFQAPRGLRVLRSSVRVEHLPEVLQERRGLTHAALPRTPLVDGFHAFARTLVAPAHDDAVPCVERVGRAVLELQCAVVVAAQSHSEALAGAAGLRHRIEDYIEAHYAEPALAPAQIADALSVSVRTAHGAFSDSGRTIARFVRDRRLTAAALELRTGGSRTGVDDVARRCGFGGADAFARAFRERFAMSPSEYRDGGHRAAAPG